MFLTSTDIWHRGVRDGQEFYEKDVILDRERDGVDRVKEVEKVKEEVQVTRVRSDSTRRRDSGRRLRRDMWTELTKDLVSKEAIEKVGYDYEEASKHFYVIEQLRYVSLYVLQMRGVIY